MPSEAPTTLSRVCILVVDSMFFTLLSLSGHKEITFMRTKTSLLSIDYFFVNIEWLKYIQISK